MTSTSVTSSKPLSDMGSYQMKNSRYLLLRVKIVFMLMLNRKLSMKKLVNVIGCYLSYYRKSEKSAKFPFAISFELSNECNANCVFCRTAQGEIYNQNPAGTTSIAKGRMPFELYTQVIDETREYLLMAILYVNGEPLIYKQLYDAIEYASRNSVATMIATNGVLLNESAIGKLLRSGIDFIKIAISGFSQETYSRQVRHGSVETIKSNLQRMHDENTKNGNRTIVMVDFMLYDYNSHEVGPAKEFCDRLGFMFNVRQGNTAHAGEPGAASGSAGASAVLCDWLWKVLTINWNGDVFPCCDYVVWSDMPEYKRIVPGSVNIAEIWNGEVAVTNRKRHRTIGRTAVPVCANCRRNSITFKY